MADRVVRGRAFAQPGPATLGLYLGSQLLLERLVLTDAQVSALPARGFRTLSAQGTCVTRHSRKLDSLAGDQGDCLAVWTGHPHSREVQGELLLGEKRTNLRPGAGDNVHTLLRPLGNPGAGHVPQLDIELPQACTFLQLLGPQLH